MTQQNYFAIVHISEKIPSMELLLWSVAQSLDSAYLCRSQGCCEGSREKAVCMLLWAPWKNRWDIRQTFENILFLNIQTAPLWSQHLYSLCCTAVIIIICSYCDNYMQFIYQHRKYNITVREKNILFCLPWEDCGCNWDAHCQLWLVHQLNPSVDKKNLVRVTHTLVTAWLVYCNIL